MSTFKGGEKIMKKYFVLVLVFLMFTFIFSLSTAAADFDGQKLNVLYMSSVYADAAREMKSEFEEKTGATVEIIDFPYSTLHEKILLDLTSGTGSYDVISNACQWDGEFAPYLESLEPYIEKDNYDTSDFIQNVFENAGIWNDTIYGIPHATTPYVMAYRTDLVDELPQTWDEYLEIAKKYTDPENDMYGVATPAAKSQFGSLFFTRLFSMGGSWADEDWNVTFDSEETRRALKHVKELLNYADPAAMSWGLDEVNNAFLNGNAVFSEAWPTLGIMQNGDNPDKSEIVGKWALAEFPNDKTGLTNLSGWDITINKSSDNKELAWEWIKMYTSKEKQKEFFDKFQIISPRKSFWEQDKIKNSEIAPLREALNKSIQWWRIPAGNEAKTNLSNAVSSYMAGQMTLEQSVQYGEMVLEEALMNNPPRAGVKNKNYLILQEQLKKNN